MVKVVVIRYVGKRKIGTAMTKREIMAVIIEAMKVVKGEERDLGLAHFHHPSNLGDKKRPKVVIARATGTRGTKVKEALNKVAQ